MSDPVYILGIESSCDETSCAVVADGRRVLSNVVASQIELHARYGGVVPEIASRAHIEAVNTVIGQAIAQSGIVPSQLSAVAVTNEPGLIGSLLIGLMAAKTLSWIWQKPLVGVNHVYAHAYGAALDNEPIEYPAAALVCSGGHTALYRCTGPTNLQLLGTTIDDAAGEAFDKVASILNLSYPGGPAIDKIAREGNPLAVDFPRTLLAGQSLDFSFSGIKTAVLYYVNGTPRKEDAKTRRRGDAEKKNEAEGFKPRTSNPETRIQHSGIASFSPQQIADTAGSFQAAVVDVLRIKLRRAAKFIGAKTLILGGGVAANSALRESLTELAATMHCTLRMPTMRFCVDNAAMIAGLGYHYLQAGMVSGLELEANATVRR